MTGTKAANSNRLENRPAKPRKWLRPGKLSVNAKHLISQAFAAEKSKDAPKPFNSIAFDRQTFGTIPLKPDKAFWRRRIAQLKGERRWRQLASAGIHSVELWDWLK